MSVISVMIFYDDNDHDDNDYDYDDYDNDNSSCIWSVNKMSMSRHHEI